jgi:hypothetical protein
LFLMNMGAAGFLKRDRLWLERGKNTKVQRLIPTAVRSDSLAIPLSIMS